MTSAQLRAQPVVVLTMPTPVIVNGRPTMPRYTAVSTSTATAKLGPHHIRVVHNPDTKHDPKKRIYTNLPPSTWTARWTVKDLPDPAGFGGFYWLGAPSSADGSSRYHNSGTHQWPCTTDTHAPAWQSQYPFKPSVAAVDHYLPGGDVVHHAAGVNINSHFIEHMWMDWGRDHRQPFTWLITAAVTAWPSTHYAHYLLDSGRSPAAAGLPHMGADDVGTPRRIRDNLPYRTSMAITQKAINATTAASGGHAIHSRTDAALRPRMYVLIADGAKSYAGAYSPGRSRLTRGTLDNTSSQHHRFYVLGRRATQMSQDYASHLLVFEMRYFARTLSTDELDKHYRQLSSVWQFYRYRYR